MIDFLRRSLQMEADKSSKLPPGCALAFQEFLDLLEVVVCVALPGLSSVVFMPEAYVRLQVGQ